MSESMSMVFYAAMMIGPIVGFVHATRWEGVKRWQLIVAAMIGGGLPAAMWAAVSGMGGMGLRDTAPFVMLVTGYAVFVGVVGLVARELGGWLSGRP